MLQASTGRNGKQKQEQKSPNLAKVFKPSPVLDECPCMKTFTKQNCLATVMQALPRTIVSLTSEKCGSGGGGGLSVTAKLEIAAATSSSIIQVAALLSL